MLKSVFLMVLLSFASVSYNQVLQMKLSTGSSGNESISDLIKDDTGNIYVCGNFSSTVNFNPEGTSYELTSVTTGDIFIAKYNSSNILQWAFNLGNEETTQIVKLSIDSEGSLLVTGNFTESIDLDPGIGSVIIDGGAFNSGFLAKYDPDGNLIFGKGFDGNIEITCMDIDNSDNILLTGKYDDIFGSCDLNPAGGAVLTGAGGFISKYDNDGVYLWDYHFENGIAKSLCTDSENNLIIVGDFDLNIDLNPAISGTEHTTWDPANSGSFIAKYDLDGNYLWSTGFISDGTIGMSSVAIGTDGFPVCGLVYTKYCSIQTGGSITYSDYSQSQNIFLSKFTDEGVNLWYKSLGNPYTYESINDLEINNLNEIILTGNYNNSFDADNSEEQHFILNKGLKDIYHLCLDPDGNYLWAFGLGSFYDEGTSKVVFMDDLNIITTGQFQLSQDMDLSDNISNVTSNGLFDFFIAKYNCSTILESSTSGYFNEYMVKDINPYESGFPQFIFSYDSCLLFIADDSIHGCEVWYTNGLEDGTRMIRDINPNGNGVFEDQWSPGLYRDPSFVRYEDYVLFKAIGGDGKLTVWKTDGTEEGTEIFVALDSIGPYSNLIVIDSILYFEGYSDIYGWELWRTNGTESGTYMVKDINPSGDGVDWWMCNLNGTLIFKGTDGVTGFELWRSDGTEAGTYMIKDVGDESSNPQRLTPTDSLVFFTNTTETYGSELWVSDGTDAGTYLVKDIYPGILSGNPYSLVAVKNRLFFNAWDETHARELWVSDGTEPGTYMVKDINTVSEEPFIYSDYTEICGKFGSDFYFTIDDGVHGSELWKTDGTEAGTYLVKDINPGPSGDGCFEFAEFDSTLFFTANDGLGYALWQTDGTEENTRKLQIGISDSYWPVYNTFNSGFVYFNGTDPILGDELWRYRLIDTFNLDLEASGAKSGTEFQLCPEYYPAYASDPSFIWEITRGAELGTIDGTGYLNLYTDLIAGDTLVVKATAMDGSKQFNYIVITMDVYTDIPTINNTDDQFRIYPNPAESELYFDLPNEISSSVWVYNTYGTCLISKTTHASNKLDINKLSSGIYIIKVVCQSGEIKISRFIKQ